MAVILGWDPERGAHWLPLFRSAAAAIATEGRGTTPWPLMPGSQLVTGDRVHLMLQGAQRGIVGYGTVRSAPFLSFTDARQRTMAQHVMISWRALLPEEDRIGTDELAARLPEFEWESLYGAEIALSDEAAARLERVWMSPHPSAGAGRARRRVALTLDERSHAVGAVDQSRWSRSAAAL